VGGSGNPGGGPCDGGGRGKGQRAHGRWRGMEVGGGHGLGWVVERRGKEVAVVGGRAVGEGGG
jgi:hypothetical protein